MKLSLAATSWSYLGLLRQRFDRWSWAVAALFLAGGALRLALAFPIHRFPADGDCILNGLCAFKVLRGETPVFFSYFRIGSPEAHLTALLFLIGGVSRTTLALGPVIVGVLTMIAWYLFTRSIVDRRTAAVALLFIAVPSPAFLFWLYMPNGYPQVVMSCAAVLWFSAWALRSPQRKPLFFALGCSAGLGLWCSLLSFGCSVPAYLWLLVKRPRVLLSRAVLLLSLAGFALGGSPWLLFNLRYGFPSLSENFAAVPVSGPEAMLDNADHLLSYKIPVLIASTDHDFRPVWSKKLGWMDAPVLWIHAAAVVVFVDLRRRRRKGGRGFDLESSAPWFFALVFVTMGCLNVFSAAGSVRGHTVRYLLPLYLIVPALLAPSLRWLAVRSRIAAGALAVFVLFFNVAGAYLPWTLERHRWQARAAEDDRFFGILEREGVEGVLGGFWQVYPINFYTRERVKAVPWNPGHDHDHVWEKLDEKPMRWALVEVPGRTAELLGWTESAGLHGDVTAVDRQRSLFLVRDPERPREFVTRMRQIYYQTP